MSLPPIDVQNLSKTFDHSPVSLFSRTRIKTTALDRIHLQIPEGEIFVLLGPNGAGKSTFLKILTGLISPDAGSVQIYGRSHREKKSVQNLSLLINDERSFYFRLSARQNLEFFAALYGFSDREKKARIEFLQKRFALDYLDLPYQECSVGMKQRLALARCFLKNSKILLMDEPTRSLDPHARRNYCQWVRDLKSQHNATILFTTHDLEEAELLADRVGILCEGRLLAVGTMDDLRKKIKNTEASLRDIYFALEPSR